MKPYCNTCPAQKRSIHLADVAMAMGVLLLAIFAVCLFAFSKEFREMVLAIRSTLLLSLR